MSEVLARLEAQLQARSLRVEDLERRFDRQTRKTEQTVEDVRDLQNCVGQFQNGLAQGALLNKRVNDATLRAPPPPSAADGDVRVPPTRRSATRRGLRPRPVAPRFSSTSDTANSR